MDNNQNQLTKKEKRELKREQRFEETAKSENRRRFIKIFKIVLILAVVGLVGAGIFFLLKNQGDNPANDIISRQGIHWHPELAVYIKGVKQEIPANIGIGFVHNPIHTHDSTGTLHLEFSGLVKKDDIKLGRFFDIWEKQFNQNCIFSAEGGSASGGEYCNGADGKVKMIVNGAENSEFENYLMKDGDKIEIRYE